MDPNETLKAMRRLSARFIKQSDDSRSHHESSTNETLDAGSCLAENFQNLDKWLTDGGFLPNDWKPEKQPAIKGPFRYENVVKEREAIHARKRSDG